MNDLKIQRKKPYWIGYYFLGAAVGIFALYVCMHLFGMSLIWGADGYLQYLPTAKYAKTLFTSMLHGQLPMIDFNLGEGLDPIQCMMYYGLSEPWSILYAITPDSFAATMYNIIVVAKILLSGLAFGWLAKKYTDNDKAVAIGALVYIFSGYFVMWLQAPVFLPAGYLFPLLIYCMDLCMDKHRYVPLAFATALAYIHNYYIGVVLSCLLLIYALIRICTNGKLTWKKIVSYIATAASHLGGILLSGFVLVPALMAISLSTRSGENTGYSASLLVYPWTYYIDLLKGMFIPVNNTMDYWNHPYQIQTNFAPIAAPALLILLTTKTEKNSKARLLKWALLACALFATVPFFGKLFNGWSYPTHRWAFAASLVISMIVVWAAPRFGNMKLWVKLASAGLLLFGCVMNFCMTTPRAAMVTLVISIVLALIAYVKPRQLTAYACAVLSAVTFLFTTLVAYPYGATFAPQEVEKRISSELYSAVQLSEEELDDFVRVAATDSPRAINLGTILQYKTTTGAWNVLPTRMGYYISSQDFPSIQSDFWIHGFDDRSVPITLAGTKYFITSSQFQDDTSHAVPYGFKLLYSKDIEYFLADNYTKSLTYYVYENQYCPGVGYLYRNSLSEETFNRLNIAEKQIALLNYAVTAEASNDTFASGAIELDKELVSNATNATLTFDAPEGYELYLSIDHVINLCSLQIPIKSPSLMRQKEERWASSADSANSSSLCATVECENGVQLIKHIYTAPEDHHMFVDDTSRTVCLGHELSGKTTITLNYATAGCSLRGCRIYAFPVAEYEDGVKTLIDNQWTDVSYSTPGHGNFIEGKINAAYDGIFQLAVPYTKGWVAYVDGKPTDIFASGIKYIGLNLTKGEHTIRFEYQTPGIMLGGIVSGVMLAVLLCAALIERRRLRSQQSRRQEHPIPATIANTPDTESNTVDDAPSSEREA